MSWRGLGCAGVSALGLVGVLVAAVGYASFAGVRPIEDQRVLPNGAVVLKDGYVSVALLPLPDGTYALIDSGNDPAGAAIDRALTARRAVRDDVKAILVTHGHPDHLAACGGFEDARIYVMRDEVRLLRGEVAPQGPIPRLLGARESRCPLDQLVPVEDGAVVALGGGAMVARAFAMPGHTAGSAAWWIGGVLFLGDAADADVDGNLHTAKWLFSDRQRRATRSLLDLAERIGSSDLRVDAMVFSHTGVLEGVAPLMAFAEARRRK